MTKNQDYKFRNPKKVVMFDFDGTIVDSMMNFAVLAGSIMHEIHGLPAKEGEKKYIITSGIPFFQQLELIFPNDKRNKVASERFEKEKLENYFTESVFDDVEDTLEYLKTKGLKSVVSSNNFQNIIDDFTKRADLKFDLVLGFKDNFAKGKDHFEFICKRWNIKPNEMLFVGDSLKDAERAIDYNVDFIGKSGLFNEKDFNDLFPNTIVIDDLTELRKIL